MDLKILLVSLLFIFIILVICVVKFKKFRFEFNPLNPATFFKLEGEAKEKEAARRVQRDKAQKKYFKPLIEKPLSTITLSNPSLEKILKEANKKIKKLSNDYSLESINLYYSPYSGLRKASVQLEYSSRWLKRIAYLYCYQDNLNISEGIQIHFADFFSPYLSDKFWEKFSRWKRAYKKALSKVPKLSINPDTQHRICYLGNNSNELFFIFDDGKTKERYEFSYFTNNRLISKWDKQEITL